MLVATRLAAGFRDEVIISPDPRICMQRGSQCSAHIVFAYATRQFASLDKLAGAMRRDIVNFLFDNLAELQAYDAVKVYYDNGQHSVAESLRRAIEYALSKNAVVYHSAQPSEYRLSQAADYICTTELTAIKYADHTATATDEKFFGKWSDFKKGILKETRKKLV